VEEGDGARHVEVNGGEDDGSINANVGGHNDL